MDKTDEQKKLLWQNRKIPFFWHIVYDNQNAMGVINWLTGEYDILDKK